MSAQTTQVKLQSNDMIATISSTRTIEEVMNAVELALMMLEDEQAIHSLYIDVNEIDELEN